MNKEFEFTKEELLELEKISKNRNYQETISMYHIAVELGYGNKGVLSAYNFNELSEMYRIAKEREDFYIEINSKILNLNKIKKHIENNRDKYKNEKSYVYRQKKELEKINSKASSKIFKKFNIEDAPNEVKIEFLKEYKKLEEHESALRKVENSKEIVDDIIIRYKGK